ncbi:hypothetical protein ACLOJK_034006 [Asimina triloba]
MEVYLYFRCPISMELMQDPVTISTGVSYDRKNIERWFFIYKKNTCPATMQTVPTFHLTPNHTLKRLILSWQHQHRHQHQHQHPHLSSSSSSNTIEFAALLKTIQSAPFKVASLKKLRSCIQANDHDHAFPRLLIDLGVIDVLEGVLLQNSADASDFSAFRACEEAVGILHHLQQFSEAALARLLSSKPECIRAMAILLQRGSAEARLHSLALLRTTWRREPELELDVFKCLLEVLSDGVCAKASSCALDALIEISGSSRRNKLKAIEAGAICVLVELLPDSSRHKCEKMLFLMKRLCEIAEGRSALEDHGAGIAVVSKKLLRVSETATKMGVKVLWLVSSFRPTQRVLEEMLMCGAVKKLLGLLHMHARCSTKNKALKIIRLHGNVWRQYPCFPREMRDFLVR